MFVILLIVFDVIECGKDVGAVLADCNGVLEMGSHLAVLGAAGPAVLFRELDILGPLANHRFDGYDHTFFEKGAGATLGDSCI